VETAGEDLVATSSPTSGEPDATSSPALMTQRRVLLLAVPIIGEYFLQTLVGAADTLMVSRLSDEALAGVGTAAEFLYFIISILVALEIGATVLISQAYGSRAISRVHEIARQALVWSMIIAIPISFAGYVLAPHIIGIFGTEPEVAALATTYLEITAATSAVLIVSLVCGAIFRGVGDSRTPLIASALANVVNIGLSYGLIFGAFGLPELGVAGSAWGAAGARLTSALLMLGLLFTGRRGLHLQLIGSWKPRIAAARSILKLGLPSSGEQIIDSAGFMTLLAIVAMLGTPALAAQQVMFTALSIAFMPAFGFGLAATTLVGQSIGGRDLPSGQEAVRISIRWAVGIASVATVVFLVTAPAIMDFFSHDPAVADAGRDALRVLAIALPIWAVWDVYAGSLRGLGDTRTPLVATAMSTWTGVALAYLVVRFADGGLGAVWLCFCIAAPIGALVNRWAFKLRARTESEKLVGATHLVANHGPGEAVEQQHGKES
jgi:multidrug resistance protein, MATE family